MLGVACLVLAAAASDVGSFEKEKAANWHHWRGPTADGTAAPTADPPVTWDATRNVRWKAPLPGRGSSTPVVWGDRVFVLSAAKTDRTAKPDELPKPTPGLDRKTTAPTHFYKLTVTCLDRATSKVRWEKMAAERVPHEGHHESHGYAAGSPTTDGQRLYVSFGSFGVYCYDLDGDLKWTRDLGRLNTRYGWGEAVTPVVHGDSLLLNWDQEIGSALYCLDAKTGEVRWKADRDEKTTWTTPLVTGHAGRTQVIVNGTTRVRSHDLKTGEVIWSCGGMTVNPIPSALRYKDAAILVSGYRGAAAVSVPLDSKGDLGTTGRVNWRHGKGTPYVPSPVLVGDRVYFTERNENLLTVLDAATGKPVLERERLPGVGQFYASPVYAGGRVYFTDRSGTTLVLKPGDAVDPLATNKLNDPVDASPVAVGRQLFLRAQANLYCIEEAAPRGGR
jgi:outer membrane protein assembly factor BamB